MKKYEITYYDEYIDDDGFLFKGFITIYTNDIKKVLWYKENDKTSIIREVLNNVK